MFRYFAFRLNWASPLLLTSWSASESQRSNVNPCWTRTNCWIKGMTSWLRLSRRWRRNSKAWQRRTLRWWARRCACNTCISVLWTTGWCCGHFFYVCVAEGEVQLSSASEETEVFEWPGSGAWRTGSSLSEASGPRAAEHHRRTGQSKCLSLKLSFLSVEPPDWNSQHKH